ncbi:jg403 [Pararge aegeria aegeria]|uniref:Jg403 protein n=1 Tax=Pararge aegeria aegeria TaxID=348720 RepID=A0A8S4QK22_9NEOP|nr:jg403 [Pararge aegeria aegeria]
MVPTIDTFFDLAKAFDLTSRLVEQAPPSGLASSTRTYSASVPYRTFCYRLDDTLSSPRLIRSLRAPHSPRFCTRSSRETFPGIYRRQSNILCDPKKSYIASQLQKAIHLLGKWFRLWRIEVNPQKSAAVRFTDKPKSRITVNPSEVTLYWRPIP